MTGLLASVATLDEIAIAIRGGADIIDCKNPAAGALGAWPVALLRAAVTKIAGMRPTSATIGDLPFRPRQVAARVRAVAATGVDYVKIGIFDGDLDGTLGELQPLARAGVRLIAVMFADRSPPLERIPEFAAVGFHGVMLDTAGKTAGGLRELLSPAALAAFIQQAHGLGLLAGLAGSLRVGDIPHLVPLGPDYLGFRGALCQGGRAGRLDPSQLAAVRQALAAAGRPVQSQARDGEGRGCDRDKPRRIAGETQQLAEAHDRPAETVGECRRHEAA